MLDFKNWRKISEDDKTTTLMHDKGHKMTLAHTKLPKIQQQALKRLKLADGTPDGSVKDQAPVNVNVSTAPAPNASFQQAQAAPINVPEAPAQPNVLLPDGSLNAPAAAKAGQQAIDLNSQVAAQTAKAQVAYQDAALKERQRLANQDAQHMQELRQHTEDFANYQKNNPINPNAYLENMGAGKKMLTGIGMILSGGGSGLSGGPNLAMDFLNKQIDRNIDAQKENFGQKRTVYGAYHDLYGNENIATNLAKVSMNDILVHQANLTAAQLGTPTAKANAMALAAQKAAENNKLLLDSAGVLSSTPNAPKAAPSEGAAPQSQSPSPSPSKQAVDAAYKSVGIDPNDPQRDQKLMQKGYDPRDVQEYAKRQDSKIGLPSAEASTGPKESPQEKLPTYSILSPDAEKKLGREIQYGPPKAREDYPSVFEQYTKAQQAEKVLNGPKGDGVGGIHDLMQRMYKNSGEGNAVTGLPGHIRRQTESSLGSIPIVGPTLSMATGVIPKDQAQKEYDSSKTTLITDLATALNGLIAPTDIERIVNANLPSYLDKPSDIANKEKAIVNMVTKAAKTSQLQRYGLSSK